VARKGAVRRPQPGKRVSRGRRANWRVRAILGGVALILVLGIWAVFARAFAPAGNTSRSRFDAIIVLGTPADSEGNPTPSQLARVTEAVHEYERGVAPRLIVTGGSTRGGFIEAQVMARTAEAEGVPGSAIFQEPEALDTIHNACYAARIMKAHGWRSAEVVSAASHLPRAGIIFSGSSLEWRTHAAPPLEPESAISHEASEALEVLKTLRYLVYANWADGC